MPTYICLMKLTDQGVKDIRNAPERIQENISSLKTFGATMKEFYAVFGEYDYVAVGEFPNDDAAMCMVMAMSAQGTVRTTVLKAFDAATFGRICKMVPERQV